MSSRFVMRERDAADYQPENHTGTRNRRLVGPGAISSDRVKVIRGTLQTGKGALEHAHPGIEQVVYLISGCAVATVDGERFDVQAGDCCHFPPDAMHSFTATGEKAAEVLVIYTPPYGERPENVRRSQRSLSSIYYPAISIWKRSSSSNQGDVVHNFLHAIRVIDLTTVVLGPCSTFLGDFGADVEISALRRSNAVRLPSA